MKFKMATKLLSGATKVMPLKFTTLEILSHFNFTKTRASSGLWHADSKLIIRIKLIIRMLSDFDGTRNHAG